MSIYETERFNKLSRSEQLEALNQIESEIIKNGDNHLIEIISLLIKYNNEKGVLPIEYLCFWKFTGSILYNFHFEEVYVSCKNISHIKRYLNIDNIIENMIYNCYYFNSLTRDEQSKALNKIKFEIDKIYCVKDSIKNNYRESKYNEWEYLAEMMRLLINYVEDVGILPITFIFFANITNNVKYTFNFNKSMTSIVRAQSHTIQYIKEYLHIEK